LGFCIWRFLFLFVNGMAFIICGWDWFGSWRTLVSWGFVPPERWKLSKGNGMKEGGDLKILA